MSHSNWPCVLLFDLAHKQYNGIIKGQLHCQISESKGRFLVSSILTFGSAWCLLMVRIQFSLIKKVKIGHPEQSLTPPRLYVQYYLIFAYIPHPPPTVLKVNVICLSPLILQQMFSYHSHVFVTFFFHSKCLRIYKFVFVEFDFQIKPTLRIQSLKCTKSCKFNTQ